MFHPVYAIDFYMMFIKIQYFLFFVIRDITFYFALIIKTQLFKRAKHAVKRLASNVIVLTERRLSQTTRSDVGTVCLQTFTWFLDVGHTGIKQIHPLSKQSDAWNRLDQMNVKITRKWDVIRYCKVLWLR